MNFLEFFSDIEYDMWQVLATDKKPIVLYGIGDGADKIVAQMEQKGIKLSGVFASDGFVPKKEKLFHGHKIESYSALKERFGEMTVLVAFGTKLDGVLENIRNINAECTLFSPDVPVFGEGIFDLEFFNKNASRLEAVFSRLADDTSRHAYISSVKYRLTGKINYLSDCETTVAESYKNILKPYNGCSYVDVGAYTGDTIEEFAEYSGKNITVHAFEPDSKNFKKLGNYCSDCGIKNISIHNNAAWDKNEDITFYSRSGRNSAGTTSHAGAKQTVIRGVMVDDFCEYADFIKIDAEGSDKKALIGMQNLIKKHAPALTVAAYHRTEDYFDIPEYVLSVFSDYDVYFRHFKHIPCWDTNFYFVRKK